MRERAAGPVVDHDLLAELLAELRAENARDRVGRAARRLRHDQPDRLVGIFGRRAGRERAGEQQQEQSKRPHVTSHVCLMSWRPVE